MAVRRFHHRALRPDALEPHDAVHPTALDRPLAQQLESELDEERLRGREVVDHDAHMLHALDRHRVRWVVERTFAWLHNFRRLRIRWERDASMHRALLSLGCALICWRRLQR